MELNEMIYKRLADCEGLVKRLAVYGDGPAIFNTEFPSDQQSGWGEKSQYPRICYRVDLQVNQERSSSGTLHITIDTEKTSKIIEELEELVREALRDVLMKPEGQAPFCFTWARTEVYQVEGAGVVCKDLLFCLLYTSDAADD